MTRKQEKTLSDIIKSHNLKVTRDRISVLGYLVSRKGVHSIDEIEKKVRDVDLVTVYRILKIFVSKGIIYQTDFRSGRSYFEYQKKHHHHIVCGKCGKKEEVKTCIPQAYFKKIVSSLRFFRNISDHSLEFFGICTRCVKL